MLAFWIIVFIVSLFVLVKGADWLIASAEKLGLALGLSPFIVGVLIVGVGTSLPELVSSFAAALKGVTDVVVANAVGSNIANILLVVGLSAIIGKRLVVTKDLVDIDIPLLAISTVLFLGVVWDKQITLGESVLMLLTYVVYVLYTVFHKEEHEHEYDLNLPKVKRISKLSQITIRDIGLLVIGILGLVFGAKYLIEALIQISANLDIAAELIAITAVALGTSLPELLVSAKAAFRKKSGIALGNILGSNVFNSLVVTGVPSLFYTLPLDAKTFTVGLPAMALATLVFLFSGISKRVHIWEGAFYLSLYILFLAKLFDWF